MAICVASALDRNVKLPDRSGIVAVGPSFTGPRTARAGGITALTAGNTKAALSLARTAVDRDPVSQAAVSLLASTLLAAGRAEEADAAFRVASAGGWRDVATQIYWLSASLAAGDYDTASMRMDAMMRLATDMAVVRDLFVSAEADPEGRAAVARRIRFAQSYLVNEYALDALKLEDQALENRIDVLDRAAAAGAPLGYDVLSPVLHSLWNRKRFDLAVRLWQRSIRGAPDPRRAIGNGGFERALPEFPAAPFDWRPSDNGSLQYEIADAPPSMQGKALRVSSASPVRENVLQQLLLLPPGLYRLSWRAIDDAGSTSPALWVQLICNGGGGVAGAERQPGGGATLVTIPDGGCESQLITIWAERNPAGGADPLWIDDIRIAPER